MWLSERPERLVTKCCTKTHRVHLLRVKYKGKWKIRLDCELKIRKENTIPRTQITFLVSTIYDFVINPTLSQCF